MPSGFVPSAFAAASSAARASGTALPHSPVYASATAIGNLFYVLATKPGMFDTLLEVVGDERRMNRFVEEHIRNEPPVRALSRMALKDVEVNGTLIPKGAHMLLVYNSGNDDETVFPEPRKFDMDRPNLGRAGADHHALADEEEHPRHR